MISLVVNKEKKEPAYLKTKKNIVLMVCSTFPPQSSVGGLRPAMFSKYLPEYGWFPIIFTRVLPQNDPSWDQTMKIDGLPCDSNRIDVVYGTSDEKNAIRNRTLTTFMKHFLFPDFAHPPGLVDKMLIKANRAFCKKKIDAVWATTPPLGCLTIAAKIAKQLGVPWIADFRDIFDKDVAGDLRTMLLHLRMKYRRLQVVKSASSVVTVSEHHAKELQEIFNRDVVVIKNGFDPDMFPAQKLHTSAPFSIVYMGRILSEWLRNPVPFFEALDALLLNGNIDKKDMEISFYGTEPELLKNMLRPYKCKSIVNCKRRINYEEVPKVLQESCILLLLTNKNRSGILTTKVFEYFAAKRPILCVPGDGGELDSLIKKTSAGVSCYNKESIVKVIKNWHKEWKEIGTVICNSKEKEILQYSREIQTGKLADLLNKACGK
jgi:glycosyltransferase involved in cell wall biosynthesis